VEAPPDPPEKATRPSALADDLFRRESARLVAALTRLLGPAHLALAEDVVQDALVAALQAWRFGAPDDPRAWILKTAKNRAIDVIRRDRRLSPLPPELESNDALSTSMDHVLSEAEDSANQLAMMFSCCHEDLSDDTRVTLILRLLCGLGPREIARAYLAETDTIARRIHRGRKQLQSLGALYDVHEPREVRDRLPSVLRALYLLFNEGYHGSDADNPLRGAMCSEALRLTDLLLGSEVTALPEVYALSALFCFDAARLGTRTDAEGVFVPLSDQDRGAWNRDLVARGIVHLATSTSTTEVTRWHLEAGIACEHAIAPSVEETNWTRIVALYDSLLEVVPGSVVALNRALAIAEIRGPAAGRDALEAVQGDERLSSYPFYWAALADIARRDGNVNDAARYYERAISASRSRAERTAYERRLYALGAESKSPRTPP
jgi:RNA polymerase sigma factor (sigma-70 family)